MDGNVNVDNKEEQNKRVGVLKRRKKKEVMKTKKEKRD